MRKRNILFVITALILVLMLTAWQKIEFNQQKSVTDHFSPELQPPWPPPFLPPQPPLPPSPPDIWNAPWHACPPTRQVWDNAPPAASLDNQLQTALAAAGITPLDPGPTPDPALVRLGRFLFFDKELSGNRDTSCATCHHPYLGTSDGLSLPVGTGTRGLGPARPLGPGRGFIPRNAPDLFNRGAPEWNTMFWDNRAGGSPQEGFSSPAGDMLPPGLDSVLAVQAMFPPTSADEMRGRPGNVDKFGQPNMVGSLHEYDFPGIWDYLMERLLAIPEYTSLFREAYPTVPASELGFQHAANAIAAFEIEAFTLLDSPWDSYVAGHDGALSEDAKRGALLFYGAAGCVECHAGNLLSDQKPHNIGVPQLGPGKGEDAPLDLGLARETGNAADRFKFRTPPLRNVGATGPWMHNGAFTTLEAAVRHHLQDKATALRTYNANQLDPALRETVQNDEQTIAAILATLDPSVQVPRNLSDQEIDQLISFLEALTAPSTFNLRDQIPDYVPSGLPVTD
jgi:cytochrome c peroxidase